MTYTSFRARDAALPYEKFTGNPLKQVTLFTGNKLDGAAVGDMKAIIK
jgi:hypothetical protein